MQYLVDTGVWLRLFDRADVEHPFIRDSLRLVRSAGHTLATCPQNIAEFWNVSTRPASARGGYGKTVETTERRVQFIERIATILDETPVAYGQWRSLLAQLQIRGVAVHDARLASMMQTSAISHLITLNPSDFSRYVGIVAVTPRELATAANP
jgi:predicted nucleic acid-binding protein